MAWSFPELQNTLLRFLEPMTTPEAEIGPHARAPRTTDGVKIDIEDVEVAVGGHVVLSNVTVHIAGGEHVAIVGASGAGKSSLAGLLLGWHQPQRGRVRVDDEPLTVARLAGVRPDIAWIDPQVHLFRSTLFENMRYGQDDDAVDRLGAAGHAAGLSGLLQRLPHGYQSPLGEAGALVSGGEGQRVRIARAFTRRTTRLVILDEPAHGLDRDERTRLLATVRDRYTGVTMLAITHDVSDTLAFDRVLVIDAGTIVEDGRPQALAERPGSKYRALLDAERAVQHDLWSGSDWRHWEMHAGVLAERPGAAGAGSAGSHVAEVRRWHRA
jgi:ATP-binding cassette subfamily B protein